MDSNLIYTKTASGEEAMRQRTRVVQRNMRMVLILVDGKATVADLCAKTASIPMTESALRDLEQGGFIEPILAQDSVWEQSKKVAQEIKAAALGHASSSSAAAARKPDSPAASTQEHFSVPVLNDVVNSSFSTFSSAPAHSVHSIEITAIDSSSIFGVESIPNFPKEPPVAVEQVKRPGLLDRLKKVFQSGKTKKTDDDFSIKPIRRGSKSAPITWPVALMYGVLGFGVLVFLAVLLFPYASYLPEAEARLAQASGQPAKVGNMRVGFYPKPGLFLSSVQLGNAGDGKEIRISEIRLIPAFGTILSARKVFREVELSGVTLPAEALVSMSSLFDTAAQPSSKVGVLHVTLERADVSFRGLVASDLSGEVKLAADGRFNALLLNSSNRSLHLEAKPAASSGVDIDLELSAWRPSQTSLFLLDSGNIKANLSGTTLTLSKIEVRIFDGMVQGLAVLQADRQPGMAGEISFERISAKRFGEALGIGPQFEGETTGKVKFTATADAWPAIFSAIDADGEFTMRRGALGRIDLTEAVRRSSGEATRGGTTRFEQMSGQFRLTPDSYRFSALALSSGLMQSVGQVTVSKDLQVSGSMEVQMRGSVNQLRVPVSISGPLKSPLVQVGRR